MEYLFHGEKVTVLGVEANAGRTIYLTENANGNLFRVPEHVLVPVPEPKEEKEMRSIAAIISGFARQPSKKRIVLK